MLFKKIGLFAIIVISLVISVVFPLQAQDQIWTNSTPIVQDAGAGPGVELGMRFISTVAGTITAIRFYKAASNIGTHVGSLWSSTGTLLGSVQFAGETASGWQQMTLPTPVAILANNPYVVSYYAPLSHFAADQNYTWPVNSPPLQASGSVYVYGPGGVFPTQNYNSTNYWVDVVFSTTVVSSSVPNMMGDTQAAATTAITGASLVVGTVTQQSSGTVPSGDVISETPAAGTSVASGSAVNLVISTGQGVGCPCTSWSSSAAPTVADAGGGPGVEVGVKFTASSSGTITGVRFYKSSANTGTHVGNLWSSTGTLLASATFSGETASGWQQVNFSSPVSITAGAVYVASYYTSVSHYSADQGFFATTGVSNGPLEALASAGNGGNGVYMYGSTSSFPSNSYNSTNYWVDVIFVPNPALSCPPPPHSAVLAWQAPSGVTQFNVYQNGVQITSSPISATTYTVSGLTAGSVLTFSVTSILNGSESSPSVLPTLTVPSP